MCEKIEFKNEYQLHNLTQKHLKELFDLEFVASEFQLNDLRLDNLAFDMKNNSFVIIEYKNTKDNNVLNQGLNYCKLLKDNQKEFIERLNKVLNPQSDINFEKTKIMIIGTEFSDEQLEKAPDNFELWKATLYENGKVTYENTKTLNIELDSLELTKDDLFENKPSKICELYEKLENCLTSNFDDLKLRILVDAVSFRVNNRLICLVNLKNTIKIHFFTEYLIDKENKTRDISDITTGGLANFEIKLESKNEIDYVKDLFKQVYDEKLLK